MIIKTDDVTSGSKDAVTGKKPKSRLLPIFSPDFTLNSQIRLFYAEKWIFLKKLGTLLNEIRNGYTDCVSPLLSCGYFGRL